MNGNFILLRDIFKKGCIIKKIDEKYLVSYYDNENKLKYKIITDDDIISESEYEIIKTRNNKINDLLNRY